MNQLEQSVAEGSHEPTPPLDGFSLEEFRARRERLKAAHPDGLILVRGRTEAESHGSPFVQDSSFFYLTGLETPGSYLVILPEGVKATAAGRSLSATAREILFIPNRNVDTEVWTGPQLGPGDSTAAAAGVDAAIASEKVWSMVASWLRRKPVIYLAAPFGSGSADTPAGRLLNQVRDAAPVAQIRDLSLTLWRERSVKSPDEIERLKAAVAVSQEGQRAARDAIADGRWEYEVEAEVLRAFRSRGAANSFPSIIGAGANGAVLHYEKNCRQMRSGELVVVDIGARLRSYCGDLTRTYPVSGVFSPRQREIHDLVEAVHTHIVRAFEPGKDSLSTLHEKAVAFLKESPLRAHDRHGEEKGMNHFMPHGLGHFLGMDVHDVGDGDATLAPGNVITIEPGIYIPREALGVRLEDDYVVTESGLESLAAPLERDAGSVEEAMRRL